LKKVTINYYFSCKIINAIIFLQVAGDGDCFFAAVIASSQRHFTGFSNKTLRHELCNYLSHNQDKVVIRNGYGNDITLKALYNPADGAQTFKDRVKQLRQTQAEYADILLIYSLANRFNLNIEVLDMHSGEYSTHVCMDHCAYTLVLVKSSSVYRIGRTLHTAEGEHYYGTTAINSETLLSGEPSPCDSSFFYINIHTATGIRGRSRSRERSIESVRSTRSDEPSHRGNSIFSEHLPMREVVVPTCRGHSIRSDNRDYVFSR